MTFRRGDKVRLTHGESRTRLYRIWRNIKSRCFNPNLPTYPEYGGRGITMCEQWSQSYETFRDWSLENGYGDDLLIDQIDNDLGYAPENCRWADIFVSNNNQRDILNIRHLGRSMSIAAWARQPECAVKEKTLRKRVSLGWAFEEALTTPLLPPLPRRRRQPRADSP